VQPVGAAGDRERPERGLLGVGQLGTVHVVPPSALHRRAGEAGHRLGGGGHARQVERRFRGARGQQLGGERAAGLRPVGVLASADAEQEEVTDAAVARREDVDDRPGIAREACGGRGGLRDRPSLAQIEAPQRVLLDGQDADRRGTGGGSEGDLHAVASLETSLSRSI
jgi:hypothetical protein